MTNLKYDVNLDKDLSLQKQAHYYDTVELEEGFDLTQKKAPTHCKQARSYSYP